MHGVQVRGKENDVYNNTFIDCDDAIFLMDIKNSKINNNTIKSSLRRSKGIFAYRTSIENSEISDNEIDVTGTAFNFIYVNEKRSEKNYKVSIKRNTFNSDFYSKILNAHNLNFENNDINTSIRIIDAGNLTFNNNGIDGSSDIYSHTLLFRGNSKNVTINSNTLIASKYKQNTYTASSQNDSEIREWDNTWKYKK